MKNLRKGQKVVCIHYKDKPVVYVDSVDVKNDQVWVNDPNPKPLASSHWYGRINWFKPVKKVRK